MRVGQEANVPSQRRERRGPAAGVSGAPAEARAACKSPIAYIDPEGCEAKLGAVETLFLDVLAGQEREAAASVEEQ